MGQRAPGHMLKARLVIHNEIGIVFRVLVHLGLQHAVDIAVAALALGTAHDQHVKVVLLHQCGGEFELGIIGLGHAAGNRSLQLGLGHFFPDLSQCHGLLHPQDLIEVGVGVGIHHENRALVLSAEVINNHAAGGGFTHTALTGNCNGMRIRHNALLSGVPGKSPGRPQGQGSFPGRTTAP